MALDVNVTIKLSEVAGSIGFGVPLILLSGAATDVAYAEYSEIDEVVAAGFDTGSVPYKLFTTIKMQENKPKYVAIVQSKSKAVDVLAALKGKVRQIITVLGANDSTATEVAAYVETTDSMTYFPVVADASEIEQFEGLDRTFVGVHSDTATQILAAGVVGATAGRDAGSFTYKNMVVKGVTPDELTDAEVREIGNETKTGKAYGYTLQRKAGDIVTTEGKAASGEYLDIADAFDWIIQNIAYRSQKLLNSSPKVPYDNAGIASLEGVTTGVLKAADNMGIIARDDAGEAMYSTDFGTRDEADPGDRSDRTYKLGRFSFELAGAIHTATINGTAIV